MPMSPRLLRPRASGARHPEALDWASRAAANGGTVDTASLAAADAFCRAVDAGGIRGKLAYVNLLIGSNLNAALVPLYRSFSFGGTAYGNATATNTNFTSENYTLAGGLNASTNGRNLNFGAAASWTASIFDLHYGVGHSTTGSSGQFQTFRLGVIDLSNRLFLDINDGSARNYIGGVVNSGFTSQRSGRFTSSRLSQTSFTAYRNGTAGTTQTSSVVNVNPSALDAVLGPGLGSGFSLWYCHLGSGLTSGDVSILDAALVSYLAVIGRS